MRENEREKRERKKKREKEREKEKPFFGLRFEASNKLKLSKYSHISSLPLLLITN